MYRLKTNLYVFTGLNDFYSGIFSFNFDSLFFVTIFLLFIMLTVS